MASKKFQSWRKKNAVQESLVPLESIVLPPLHIKLELMKQFVKATDKSGHRYSYLSLAFPRRSAARVKGVFISLQIRKLQKGHLIY